MPEFEPEHLARLVALSDDLICVGGADGRFVRVSPSWTRALGYDEATLLEIPFVDFVHPADAADTLRQMRRVLRGGRLAQFANRMRHRDGHYRWLRWNVAPALGSSFAYGIARDITELREVVDGLEVERRLRETAERQLSAEIARARAVQAAFFPSSPLRRAGIQVAGRCIATEEMSGDFLDWHELADAAVSITVGDVMGKGFSAALLMATTQAVLRAGEATRGEIDPARQLNQTNATLADYLGRSSRFVTVFRATVSVSGHVRYADAGHGHALVRRVDGTFEDLGGDPTPGGGLPLGIDPSARYKASDAQLAPGDVLIVATDGLRDVLDGVGPHGWAHHIAASVSDWGDAEAIADEIVLWAESATAGVGASDDLTVLVVAFGTQDAKHAQDAVAPSFTVEPTLSALASVEAAVGRALSDVGAPGSAVDRFVLALHEVLANVVDHARPPSAIAVDLRFDPAGRRVLVTIEDCGAGFSEPGGATYWAGAHPSVARGRGLLICRRVLDVFEYERRGDMNRWRLEMALDPSEPTPDSDSGTLRKEQAMDGVVQGSPVVFSVSGRLDIATAPEVAAELATAVENGGPRLVVRLGELTFIDSSGLGMLVSVQKELTRKGGRLVLSEVPPQSAMALRLTRLEWLLPSFGTLEEAVAA